MSGDCRQGPDAPIQRQNGSRTDYRLIQIFPELICNLFEFFECLQPNYRQVQICTFVLFHLANVSRSLGCRQTRQFLVDNYSFLIPINLYQLIPNICKLLVNGVALVEAFRVQYPYCSRSLFQGKFADSFPCS